MEEQERCFEKYLQCTIGFHAKMLSDEEYKHIYPLLYKENALKEDGVSIVPYQDVFTDFNKYHCFVSLMNLGEIKSAFGRAMDLSDIMVMQKEFESTISENKDKFMQILSKLNLSHKFQDISLLVYIPT